MGTPVASRICIRTKRLISDWILSGCDSKASWTDLLRNKQKTVTTHSLYVTSAVFILDRHLSEHHQNMEQMHTTDSKQSLDSFRMHWHSMPK